MSEFLDGPTIVSWAQRAAAVLRESQADINRLNVFPIPDADTGSNMAATMEAAVAAVREVDESNLPAVTAALTQGAVRGARGNSGLVLGQVLRALAAASAEGPLDGRAVAETLAQASAFVRAAITTPVEGTVVSVLDAAAAAAEAAVGEGLRGVVVAALHGAEQALARTPEQLPVLAEAGVVDAGGQGFVAVWRVLSEVIPMPRVAPVQELEVMFFFEGDAEGLRAELAALGNSLIVAPAASGATVHIHTLEAGRVIELAYSRGSVSDLRLEVLPAVVSPEPAATLPVVALCPPGDIAQVFAEAGANPVEWPGEIPASARIILSNGVPLQRAQVPASAVVIETEAVVGGLAALAVYHEETDSVEEMVEAVTSQRWANVPVSACVPDPAPAVQLIESLISDTDGELVTIVWDGQALPEDGVGALCAAVSAAFPGVEIDVVPAAGLFADADAAVQVGVE